MSTWDSMHRRNNLCFRDVGNFLIRRPIRDLWFFSQWEIFVQIYHSRWFIGKYFFPNQCVIYRRSADKHPDFSWIIDDHPLNRTPIIYWVNCSAVFWSTLKQTFIKKLSKIFSTFVADKPAYGNGYNNNVGQYQNTGYNTDTPGMKLNHFENNWFCNDLFRHISFCFDYKDQFRWFYQPIKSLYLV
jgi:hypothetical protein